MVALPNSLRAARDNVHHHYDLGNSFYQQWLDQELVYTCAYFERPEMSLDEAQRAKLDLVCRKLQLRPGDTVVEAGCGWGALALFMARHYGVRVKAFNVSTEQLAFARDRAAREGLTDRVEFIDDDYRNVRGTYDVFVSIGMLEHVGLAHLHTLADVLGRTLRRDGGRGLLHFIGRDTPCPLNPWIRRRIFPGAYTPTLAEVTRRVLEPAGMSVVDVENLRLHYAQDARVVGRPVRRRHEIRSESAMVTSSRARGSSTWRARRLRSRRGGCNCSRSSSRRASRCRRSGRARISTSITGPRHDSVMMRSSSAAARRARPARARCGARAGTSCSSTARPFRATRSAPAG